MYYYLIPESEMKNIYIEESFYEIYEKSPSTADIIKFEKTIRKINIIEQHAVDGEIVNLTVNYYMLKYKTKFPTVSVEFTKKTTQQIKEIINSLSEEV